MATKTALNAKNLEALGPERLAELLTEITADNPAAKRRLRMELARAQNPAEVAKEVRKRLTIIARSRSFVDRHGARSLADDLNSQRHAIAETVAKLDPTEALDLLWRFMALAPAVFERCDDSNGTVTGVFREGCRDIGDVAAKAKADPTALADQISNRATILPRPASRAPTASYMRSRCAFSPNRCAASARGNTRGISSPIQ